MGGRPFQSSLIPYEDEIARLRSARPPVSYARIAAFLHEQHGLNIRRGAIAKFVKVRSGGRRVFFFRDGRAAKTPVSVQPAVPPAPLDRDAPSSAATDSPPRPRFEFTYSERYNLKRLPDDVAAAIREKLEAEGH